MLQIDSLSIHIGAFPILRSVSFGLDPSDTLGVVGESGSGKSMMALAILGLLPAQMRASGRILFEGVNLLDASEEALCALRGRRIGMVFQEPSSALNPVQSVGDQIAEGLILHGVMSASAARQEAMRLLGRVGIEAPERRIHSFPHELSGGQRQRVMLAMAIACKPGILIADEPTSALDVTVQADILGLLREIQLETGMAMLFISHDLAVISRIARRSMVLYGGAMMEMGETQALLHHPRHPYTSGLLAALPHRQKSDLQKTRLQPIPGHIPALNLMPPGCPFHGRCPQGDARCYAERPPRVSGKTDAWCFHPQAQT